MERETEEIREMTRGEVNVECPDCGQIVHWGSLRIHRIEMCDESSMKPID